MLNGNLELLDVVLIIDDTESMKPFIQRFSSLMTSFMNNLQTQTKQIRLQYLLFRDYADHPFAIRKSRHFMLPQDNHAVVEFAKTIIATLEGDEPENGLEAIAVAMQNNWQIDKIPSKGLIVMWTDAPAHPLTPGLSRAEFPGYPPLMPTSVAALSMIWDQLQQKRHQVHPQHSPIHMVLFAPNDPETYQKVDLFPWTSLVPTLIGNGIKELTKEGMIASIMTVFETK